MLRIVQYEEKHRQGWDEYVSSHPEGTCYHLSAWKRAIERAYKHRPYYLIAMKSGAEGDLKSARDTIAGILPLFYLRHPLFGNKLVSLPFCDYGGVLAGNEDVTTALLEASIRLSHELNDAILEFRHASKILSGYLTTGSHKVRVILGLNGDAELLWNGFSPKLRSQIRKPEKEGLVPKFGSLDVLDDFYRVWSFNMRDLGSPVHSKAFIKAVLEEFSESSKLQVVYKERAPIGTGLIICFKDTVYIPWASTLRKFNYLSPNMMLYWNFLKYAADSAFRQFDFGRSTPGEGTYKFKEQWGAKPSPLYWQCFGENGVEHTASNGDLSSKFGSFVPIWKRLPLPVANMVGPLIRKHISL